MLVSRRSPGKLISAGSVARHAGYVAARYRTSTLRPGPSTECLESVFSGAALGLPMKKVVSRSRRCVEARALPAGRLSAGGQEIVLASTPPMTAMYWPMYFLTECEYIS